MQVLHQLKICPISGIAQPTMLFDRWCAWLHMINHEFDVFDEFLEECIEYNVKITFFSLPKKTRFEVAEKPV